MVRAPKKALKIGRALKSAAIYPVQRVSSVSIGKNPFSPLSGEAPVVVLKVQVLSCKGLVAKDKNGFSDPFVVVSLLSSRHQTPVCKRTLNPVYTRDATFEYPLYISLADKLGVVELVIWDKDTFKSDYIGEVSIPLEDWFKDGNSFAFDDPSNKPLDIPVVSTRVNTPSQGTIQVKLGFVSPPNVSALMEFSEVYGELLKLSRPSLTSAPPTEGIGTIRSYQIGPQFQDDGLSSDSDSEDEDEDSSPDYPMPPQASEIRQPRPISAIPESTSAVATPTPSNVTIPGPSGVLPVLAPLFPLKQSTKPPSPAPSGFSIPSIPIPKLFPRRTQNRSPSLDSSVISSLSSSTSTSGSGGSGGAPALSTPSTSLPPSGASTPTASRPTTNKRFSRKSWAGNKQVDFNFSAGKDDILGIVMLEIVNAKDLPKLKNFTRTGYDMDPFVVISFGKKVFRTRVIRHSLNPVWDEKLLFHVRRYEASFQLQLGVLDWDKLSSNDHVGDASVNVAQLIRDAPQKDERTGLYEENEDGTKDAMKEFVLPLLTGKEAPWESKHNPTLTIRAKYQPYDALRQRFWRTYLKQYDADENGTISHIELTSMLDSLGSTLSQGTIDDFYTRFGKKPHEDSLTMNEAIQCLEEELCRPTSEKKRLEFGSVDSVGTGLDSSSPVTPSVTQQPSQGLNLDKLNFAGPAANVGSGGGRSGAPDSLDLTKKPAPPPPAYRTEAPEAPLTDIARSSRHAKSGSQSSSSDVEENLSSSSGSSSPHGSGNGFASSPNRVLHSSASGGSGNSGNGSSETFERVINVKNCPLCHRPRMSSKAEMDIVTHLAICASQDWARVDKIVVGNFVTASQAQRKWYTKMIAKVSAGNYKLGANSANIIVQNRMTGQLEEEKMQVYVRLGIRLLYKGWTSRMEGARARGLLKSMSIKQGLKYDSPESARDIPAFIEFHNLKVDEIRDPLSSFRTFNEFFYRKLKLDARPVESPEDPYRLVSGADCRLMAFESVSEATRLWIKGREFTVSRLLGDAVKEGGGIGDVEKYNGGALCIFRLAPQDYHRFHVPVDGVIGPMTDIAGEYYTVNPQAIRTALDVYGENVRKIVPIDSPQFGRVVMVCVGAMMVGSIQTTVKEGQAVKRGEEFGYFAFGGSTIVVLFERGVVEWDEDLLINGKACLETLVRVGMGLGRSTRGPSLLSSTSLAELSR